MSDTVTLTVTGMTCQHCVAAVREALQAVEGVQEAEVSLADNRATVKGQADPAALIAALQESGYTATLS